MNEQIITRLVLVMLCAVATCRASVEPESSATPTQECKKTDPVDAVLEKLNRRTLQLESYEGQIEYEFVQPLLESKALRKGIFHYAKYDGQPMLRIDFNTLKQEDEKEQKYMEQYIVLEGTQLRRGDYDFKGIWLVHIDYQIEEAKYYQIAEPNDPNRPVDVFDLASRDLPMLGFTKIEDLKKQFEVELVEQKKAESEDFTQVHLRVKPNSVYKDNYVSIDFWIDQKLGLPVKILAVATEPEPPFGDVYHIRFLNPKVNKGIDKKVFEFKIPKGFGEEIMPLKETDK